MQTDARARGRVPQKEERKRRAGTENVPGIVGLGKAIEIATSNIIEHSDKVKKIRDFKQTDLKSLQKFADMFI